MYGAAVCGVHPSPSVHPSIRPSIRGRVLQSIHMHECALPTWRHQPTHAVWRLAAPLTLPARSSPMRHLNGIADVDWCRVVSSRMAAWLIQASPAVSHATGQRSGTMAIESMAVFRCASFHCVRNPCCASHQTELKMSSTCRATRARVSSTSEMSHAALAQSAAAFYAILQQRRVRVLLLAVRQYRPLILIPVSSAACCAAPAVALLGGPGCDERMWGQDRG